MTGTSIAKLADSVIVCKLLKVLCSFEARAWADSVSTESSTGVEECIPSQLGNVCYPVPDQWLG